MIKKTILKSTATKFSLFLLLGLVAGGIFSYKTWVGIFSADDDALLIAQSEKKSISYNDNVTGRYLGFLHTEQNNHFSKSADLASLLIEDIDSKAFQENSLVVFLETGRFDQALTLAKKIQHNKNIYSNFANILLSLDALKANDLAKAEIIASRLGGFGDIPTLAANLFNLWLGNNSPEEIQQLIEKVEKYNSPTYTIGVAYFLLLEQQPTKALRLLETLEDQRLPQQVIEAEIHNLLALNRFQEAEEKLENYLSVTPTAKPVFDQLYQAIRKKTAIKITDRPIMHLSDSLINMGEELAENNGKLSLILLQLALYANPDNDYGRLFLAYIQNAFGQYQEGLDNLKGIPRQSRFFQESLFEKARLLRSDNRDDEALAILKDLEKFDVSARRTYTEQGRLYAQGEDFDLASKNYSRAIEHIETVAAGDWQLFYERGISYALSDRWTRAEADFLKALDLSPNQPLVLNYLAYSWIERGENLERARNMLEEAVGQRRDSGFIVDSLGWAYYHLKDYESAVFWLEQAITLTPQDTTINDHLGDAYWQSKRYNEARFQWQRALNLKPEEKNISIIKEKISSGLKANVSG